MACCEPEVRRDLDIRVPAPRAELPGDPLLPTLTPRRSRFQKAYELRPGQDLAFVTKRGGNSDPLDWRYGLAYEDKQDYLLVTKIDPTGPAHGNVELSDR